MIVDECAGVFVSLVLSPPLHYSHCVGFVSCTILAACGPAAFLRCGDAWFSVLSPRKEKQFIPVFLHAFLPRFRGRKPRFFPFLLFIGVLGDWKTGLRVFLMEEGVGGLG